MKLLLFLTTFIPSILSNNTSSLSWAVWKESTVSISGSSNVNHFIFTSGFYEGKDTMVISLASQGKKFLFEKGLLQMPVKNFRNSNARLTRDFKKTLNAAAYPNILMNFRSISGLNQQAEAKVEITLAGKTITRYLKLENCQKNNCLNLKGKEIMKFSDFGLKPPKNVLGFIDVKDELEVEFNLVLKQVR